MAIKIEIDDAVIQQVADEAVQKAVLNAVTSSGAIKAAVEAALKSVKIDTKQIEDCLQASLAEVFADRTFFHEMIKQAFVDNKDKLRGNFEASVKKAGRDLAMPREVIDEVATRVKTALLADYEEKGGGTFS